MTAIRRTFPRSERDGASTVEKPQQEFVIITKAKDLVKHTFCLTNGKSFPKKERFCLVNRMQDRALGIFEDVQEANELDLNDPREFRERQYLQKRALTRCKTMLFFIELAKERGYIDADSCKYWTRFVLDVKYMTAKWKKQERLRAEAGGAGPVPQPQRRN